MADELAEFPTAAELAALDTKRYKQHLERINPGARNILAVAVIKSKIGQHFGEFLETNANAKLPRDFYGIRIYIGLTEDGDRRLYLVVTVPGEKIPLEDLRQVYHLRNVSFDLERIALLQEDEPDDLDSNHIVCQPDCALKQSLYAM